MMTFCIPETVIPTNDELFMELVRKNPESRIERTAQGEIQIMAPTGGETGKNNFTVGYFFQAWNRKSKLGKFFDSSTAFRLPSSSIRSPDVSFVTKERWNALSQADRESFPPLCPDFVLEIRSKTDRLTDLQEKMEEWMSNGCKLGWLLDLDNLQFFIYRPGREKEALTGLDTILYGENILEGFQLSIQDLLNESE
ncbi:MAG: Uma2 family endonuclease [Leptospira sp.]|nr:Uma2 family endonuclease [Leptospira sp.]